MAYQNPQLVEKLSKDYTVKVIQPWHLRINNTIDIYPKAKKFFILSQRKWGSYKKLKSLLHAIFVKKNEGAPKKAKGFQAWLATNPGPGEVYCVQLTTPPHIKAAIQRTLSRKRK